MHMVHFMMIIKALLIHASMLAYLYATTAPNARPPAEQLREQHGTEHFASHSVVFARVLSLAPALLELVALLVLSDPCPPLLAPLRTIHPFAWTPHPAPTTLPPAFLAGTCLTLAGAYLRAHCFRLLGPHFTFELAIRPRHALVTHGAYGVVRHPSYTGILVLVLGWLFLLYDQRHWAVGVCVRMLRSGMAPGVPLDACQSMIHGALACVWVTTLGMTYVLLNKRMDKEDAMLEGHFGEAWRTWARRIPCRLIPGIC